MLGEKIVGQCIKLEYSSVVCYDCVYFDNILNCGKFRQRINIECSSVAEKSEFNLKTVATWL